MHRRLFGGALEQARAAGYPFLCMKSSEFPSASPLPAICRVSGDDRDLTVWLQVEGRRRTLVGRVNKLLARDALRHGQDLVEELFNRALVKAERLSLAQRHER